MERHPCPRHALLEMDGGEESAEELLPCTEADGQQTRGSEDRTTCLAPSFKLNGLMPVFC